MARRIRHVATVLAMVLPCAAHAFTVAINPGPRAVYLRVGTGAYTGTPYVSNPNTLRNSSTINLVSVTVPANQVGNGTDLVMSVDGGSGQFISHYDNFQFCNAPSEVYIGGFFRRPGNGNGSATLTVTTPATLVNADGDLLPISQLSWTTSGNGDSGPQPIPAGTFSGGTQTLATFVRNTWNESCMTFRYGNDQAVAAGTYTARATYTLTVP